MVFSNTIVFYAIGCLVAFLKTMFLKQWYSRYHDICGVLYPVWNQSLSKLWFLNTVVYKSHDINTMVFKYQVSSQFLLEPVLVWFHGTHLTLINQLIR